MQKSASIQPTNCTKRYSKNIGPIAPPKCGARGTAFQSCGRTKILPGVILRARGWSSVVSKALFLAAVNGMIVAIEKVLLHFVFPLKIYLLSMCEKSAPPAERARGSCSARRNAHSEPGSRVPRRTKSAGISQMFSFQNPNSENMKKFFRAFNFAC